MGLRHLFDHEAASREQILRFLVDALAVLQRAGGVECHGQPGRRRGRREAERARRLLIVSLRLRGIAFPGQRGRTYAETARWLADSPVEEMLAG